MAIEHSGRSIYVGREFLLKYSVVPTLANATDDSVVTKSLVHEMMKSRQTNIVMSKRNFRVMRENYLTSDFTSLLFNGIEGVRIENDGITLPADKTYKLYVSCAFIANK